MTRAFNTTFLAALLVRTALSAQAPPMGPDGIPGQGPCPPPMAQPGRPGPMGPMPGPGPLGLLRFLDLTETQQKAVRTILDRRRPVQAARMREVAERESALRQGLEDPALSEAQIRGLQAAESEARLQAVLEERAAFLEVHAVLSGDQQAKAQRLSRKLEREREARLDLMAETGGAGPEFGPAPRP